jgi:hypothetical protein
VTSDEAKLLGLVTRHSSLVTCYTILMLTSIHSWVGTLVIGANAAVALWYGLRPVVGSAGHWLLLLARLSLALQLLLGLSLVAQGYVGQNLHYLGAIGAAVAAWITAQQSRKASQPQRVLALGHGAVALLAGLAYLASRE